MHGVEMTIDVPRGSSSGSSSWGANGPRNSTRSLFALCFPRVVRRGCTTALGLDGRHSPLSGHDPNIGRCTGTAGSARAAAGPLGQRMRIGVGGVVRFRRVEVIAPLG